MLNLRRPKLDRGITCIYVHCKHIVGMWSICIHIGEAMYFYVNMNCVEIDVEKACKLNIFVLTSGIRLEALMNLIKLFM